MKKFIYLLFGKPHDENKYYSLIYKFAVGFYLLSMTLFLIQSILYGGMVWFSFFFSAIVFPVLFRVVYKVNISFRQHFTKSGSLKKKLKWPLIIGSVFVLFTTLVITLFLFGNQVAVNVNKTTVNGDIELSIGSLKGDYQIETFELSEPQEETIVIPFQLNVEEGEVTLYIKHQNETVWEKTYVSSEEETIEFIGVKGVYEVGFTTESASNIQLNLSLY
ncbi:hypothetical protein [Metabacillus litoralis]|uniref:hypothetical protein n=1 Tax=Metabacillus litoralis TaxID=152268 RepID=UPI001CFD92C2|nr:hypothetical protein [Metabacillus litoralis]